MSSAAIGPSELDVGTREVPDRSRLSALWIGLLLLVGVLSLLVFVRMTSAGVASDLILHTEIAQKEFESGRWFTYTLWSPLIILASLNGHLVPIRSAVVVLLALAVVAKVVVSRHALVEWGASRRAAVLVAVGCAICTPVLGIGVPARNGQVVDGLLAGSIYLGRLSSTVWHNSTSVAALPLVLVAAIAAHRALTDFSLRRGALLGLAMALSALMKPNWALAALPVVLVWGVTCSRRRLRTKWTRLLVWVIVGAVPTAIVLVVQLVLVRSDPFVVPSEFTWEPLRVWKFYAASPAMAWIQSLLFPLFATGCVVARRQRGVWWLWCSWSVMLVATLQMALLGERNRTTGAPIFDGNWFWGAHAAVLVLFLASAAALSSGARATNDSPLQRALMNLAWGAFVLHVTTGAIYIARLFQLPAGFAS
ncbi:MAG: hypothetical protein HY828_13760 [Actinobacteria bacterium]|nr:hypothetical protein [Actinomycetota bacterium]